MTIQQSSNLESVSNLVTRIESKNARIYYKTFIKALIYQKAEVRKYDFEVLWHSSQHKIF